MFWHGQWNSASTLSSRLLRGKDLVGMHSTGRNWITWWKEIFLQKSTASNVHGQECVCFQGEEADIKMIDQVADAVENFHWSTMIRNFALFFSLRFLHYLGDWNTLIYTWGILSVLWDRKYPAHTFCKGLWSIYLYTFLLPALRALTVCDTDSFSAGHRIAIERKHCYF